MISEVEAKLPLGPLAPTGRLAPESDTVTDRTQGYSFSAIWRACHSIPRKASSIAR